ncbi:MAG: prepilin peptidase [Selenomonadaceae bacterium]|nr:prepilin peptidase [Selenomonadaceae bacterium]
MLTAIVLSAVLTLAGSRWIDFLYRMPTAPLTFPDEISTRARFRKPLLAVLMFAGFASAPEIYWAAVFFLALITATDFEQYVIFDRMLVPFALIGILAAVYLGLPLGERFLAAAVGGGIFLAIAFVSRGGIGGGDIKLVATLGLWLGAENLLNVVIYACIGGGIAAVALILAGKKSRDSYFAYGPYFALAAMYFLCTQ